VIAISESTKRDVVAQFRIPSERVDVIYPGIDKRFRAAPRGTVAEFCARRGLPEKFILCLGTIEPRKNLSNLIRAYAKVRPPGVKLICAGGKGWMYQDVFRTVEELHMGSDVLFPGFVPNDELPLWYSAAMAFVYPSSYEGFGIPVLEALACSTPTVATASSSLPEVAGDAALLVPDNDIEVLTEAVSRILADNNLRADLSAAGPQQAKKFCWRKAGQLTACSHARALGLSPSPLLDPGSSDAS
jgi:glycosyltransferase involved in cell wall biosynthesis